MSCWSIMRTPHLQWILAFTKPMLSEVLTVRDMRLPFLGLAKIVNDVFTKYIVHPG